MKFFDKVLFALTIAAHAAVGLTELFAWAVGYEVTWTYVTLVVVVLALLTVASVVRLFCISAQAKTTAFAIALSLLTVVSTFLLSTPQVYWLHVIMLIATFCGVCRGVRPLWLKITAATLSFMLIGFVVAALMVASVFGGLANGAEEVVKTIPSPDGTHEVQIVAASDGALGGSTIVQSRDAGTRVDAFVCAFEKPATQLATYETYGAHEDVAVTWVDNDTVSVHCAGEYDRTTEFDVK